MKKLLFLLILPLINLNAQNFSGSWGYKIDGKEITVYGDKIQNQNNGGRTGTLKKQYGRLIILTMVVTLMDIICLKEHLNP